MKFLDTSESINNLPDALLEEILLRVPGEALCKQASLVTKHWHNLIDSEVFWIKKSLREDRLTKRVLNALRGQSSFNAKQVYFKNIFKTNLLKNSCGNERFKHWLYTSSYEMATFLKSEEYAKKYINMFKKNGLDARWHNDWWRVESDQTGMCKESLLLDRNDKIIKNFVTSHRFVGKLQVIDLHNCLTTKFIEQVPFLKLEVSEWYAARVDCGSKYVLAIHLIDDNFNMVDNVIFEKKTLASNGGKWNLTSHVFEIKQPVRYVIFYHAGCDVKTLNGYYGSKMTNGSVRFLVDE